MTQPSSWSPLRRRTFRALWLAQLGSNIGTWMQTVAAQWLMVGHKDAATLVSLVQTVSLLPVLFLSLPAGVLADTLDRRKLLYATTAVMAVVAGALAVVTAAGTIEPAVLLAFTFVIGCGAALTTPAWQAIQPELVPREEIPAAAALGSVTVNGARVIGPALAGFLVAWIGPAPVFALNAVSFVGIAAATFAWRQSRPSGGSDREPVTEAIAAGLRYLFAAPGVRRVILRSVLFAAPASALWALLPLAGHQRFGLGASGYGGLLAALGVGAVTGVVVLPRLRAVWSPNIILAVSALTFGLGAAAMAFLPLVVAVVALGAAGVAWIATLSSLNATMQLALPAWVRARGMAAYILAFMGSQAIAAFGWGALAQATSVRTTLTISAVVLALAALSVRVLPLHALTGTFDRTPVVDWPTPTLVFEPAPADGPVLVSAVYQVSEANEERFMGAMRALELSRRRTGAARWRLYRDGADDRRFVEEFTVPSWGEHLRQHADRRTGADRDALTAVLELADPAEHQVRHLFPARTGRVPG